MESINDPLALGHKMMLPPRLQKIVVAQAEYDSGWRNWSGELAELILAQRMVGAHVHFHTLRIDDGWDNVLRNFMWQGSRPATLTN